MILGLACLALVVANRVRHSHDHGAPAKIPDLEVIGPQNAPIEIAACYPRPSADADTTLPLLRRLVGEYDPHLRVTAINAATRKGRRKLRAAGLEQGGLTVNGRKDFARVVSGRLRRIEFL